MKFQKLDKYHKCVQSKHHQNASLIPIYSTEVQTTMSKTCCGQRLMCETPHAYGVSCPATPTMRRGGYLTEKSTPNTTGG